MHGLPSRVFDSLIEAMADVIDYPDDPPRTFPTSEPYVRRVEFGGVGLRAMLETCGTAGKRMRKGCTFPVIES